LKYFGLSIELNLSNSHPETNKPLNYQLMLSHFQTLKLTYIFNLLDFDRNGFIERNDFVNIAEKLCVVRGEETDTPESEDILKQCSNLWRGLEQYIDVNNDGKCTIAEWLKFINDKLINSEPQTRATFLKSVVGSVFDLYDTDRDGDISLPEYLDIFLSFELKSSLVGKSFVSLDANGDGAISKEELIASITEFLVSDDPDLTGNWIFGDIYNFAL